MFERNKPEGAAISLTVGPTCCESGGIGKLNYFGNMYSKFEI